MNTPSFFLALGSALSFFAVGLGAFGAHGLKRYLDSDLMAVYQTAVQYHAVHALATCLIGVLLMIHPDIKWFTWSGLAFATGILLFSGSLYILATSGVKFLGVVTPAGGLLFLVGWFCLFVGAQKI